MALILSEGETLLEATESLLRKAAKQYSGRKRGGFRLKSEASQAQSFYNGSRTALMEVLELLYNEEYKDSSGYTRALALSRSIEIEYGI